MEKLGENQCPRCLHMIPNDYEPGAYGGALSRADNKTEICSDCGSDEAMRQAFGNGDLGWPLEVDHRVREKR